MNREKLILEMEDMIDDLFSGKEDEIKIFNVLPSDVIRHIEKETGESLTEIDTNGWDVDFFISFNHKGNSYCLSGSVYNYNYIKIDKE